MVFSSTLFVENYHILESQKRCASVSLKWQLLSVCGVNSNATQNGLLSVCCLSVNKDSWSLTTALVKAACMTPPGYPQLENC